ncbi:MULTISPECIES: LysR family transcriptional regulator [unclassified Chelatococcus]|uniref:LysR family transcriptional regulator n=1 Tax=unclassified Chelatococcus TaxID=2638111 RepID=UPI001BCEB9D4|nr:MULTISPECIES: LysR family transcriptional regulator [unclassified Chelatococcus]MBS7696491.1 LysR family transcriptional regulator [Chelatococcus sp. YT9]MBX3555057.1 LysR family transcriptional regulator [Chelatococcus sp.]
MIDLGDLNAFVVVARTKGFRDGARQSGASASALSEAVRRLEAQLGVRLFHRTTRSVVPTEAGRRLLERLGPALQEVDIALGVVNDFRDRPAGTLKLNVPVSAARLVLPRIVPAFIAAYPEIRLEVITEESFIDTLAAGCDAGIRYEERLEQDMVAVPIGPRIQRYATAASPAYLDRHGRPEHPRDLLAHACLRHRFPSGAMPAWEFERDGEIVRVDPSGPLIVQAGGGSDLAVHSALAGAGIVGLFEDWLRPHLESGALEPVLEPWWQSFPGPFLYYPGRRLVPAPLRAFVDFVKTAAARAERPTPHGGEATSRSQPHGWTSD